MSFWRTSLTRAGLIVAAGCLCAASYMPRANAELLLKVTDGVHTGSANDSSTPGLASFSGSIGNFTFSSNAGLGFPAAGLASDPILILGSLDITLFHGGTLTVSLTETGFGPTTATKFLSSIAGTYDGSTATLSTYYDTSDTPFGTGSELASGLLDNKFVYTSVPSISGPYSLTEVATVTAGAFSFTGFDASIIAVPEPRSASILGAALLALGLYGLRRRARLNRR